MSVYGLFIHSGKVIQSQLDGSTVATVQQEYLRVTEMWYISLSEQQLQYNHFMVCKEYATVYSI